MSLPRVLSGRRRWRFGYLVVNGVAQAAVAVATARLVQTGFDTLVSAARPMTWSDAGVFGGGLAAAIAVGAWLRWRGHLDAEHLGQDYIHDVRMRLFRHVSRIGADGARQMSRGAIVLRFVGDLTALKQWVSYGLARLTVSGLATVLAIGVLSLIEPVVAIAVAIAVAVAALLALGIGPQLRVTTRESRRRRGRLAAMLNDRVSHIGVVEAFGQERRERKRFEKLSTSLVGALIDRARVVGLLRALSEASATFASMCALFVGALQVGMGHATPGAVVAAMVVAGLLATRLQDLGRVYEYWNGALIAREKQRQLLALEPVSRPLRYEESLPLDSGPGCLELRDVSLTGVFDGLNATVRAGERIAVVGPNGAGKTTLLRIMAGIIKPHDGAVLLDGQDLATARWRDVRRAVAIVSPDLPLLRGSLRFNLTYGGRDRSDTDLARMLSQLGMDRLVERLPKGLDSRVSEHGEGLSTGERARIALARAMLVRPRLLLLDEADANLDQAARAALAQVVRTFDGTVVFITHDRSRTAGAHRIFHLKDGGLVAHDAPAFDPDADHSPALRLVT